MKEKNLFDYFKSCILDNYANFSGRARRKEYWGFYLFHLILISILGQIDTKLFGVFLMDHPWLSWLNLSILATLLLWLPSTAVSVRRFHDRNKGALVPVAIHILTLLTLVFPTNRLYSDYLNEPGLNASISATLGIILGVVFVTIAIYAFVVHVTNGQQGSNQYGPDPKNPEIENELDAIGTE